MKILVKLDNDNTNRKISIMFLNIREPYFYLSHLKNCSKRYFGYKIVQNNIFSIKIRVKIDI